MSDRFPMWLQRQLQRREMRQADLARRVGTSKGTVSAWVNGQRVPDPGSCDRIAHALGVDLDDVLVVAGHRPRIVVEELAEVRQVVALMRGMPTDVRRQVVEFAEWHRERLRRAQECAR